MVPKGFQVEVTFGFKKGFLKSGSSREMQVMGLKERDPEAGAKA